MKYFSKRVYWTVQLSWWLFTTFILRFPNSKYFSNNPEAKYSYLIISFLIGIVFTHFYAYIFQKKYRNNQNTIFFAISGAILTGGTIYLLDYYFGFQRYRKPNEGIPLEVYDYFQFFIESIRYVGLWFLFYHLLVSNAESQHKAVALAQSETALKTAELANLKNQLNPHFLFNAINSIKALTISDPSLARTSLTQLSELLRSSLTVGNEQLITLESEINFVKDYLFLEKIRYEKRLSYKFDIDKGSLNIKVPPMTLQLLVENAIKHGISKLKHGGDIMIHSIYEQNTFILTVSNSGKISKDYSPTGVGIKNLEKRLFLNFNEKAEFNLSQSHNRVITKIVIKQTPS